MPSNCLSLSFLKWVSIQFFRNSLIQISNVESKKHEKIHPFTYFEWCSGEFWDFLINKLLVNKWFNVICSFGFTDDSKVCCFLLFQQHHPRYSLFHGTEITLERTVSVTKMTIICSPIKNNSKKRITFDFWFWIPNENDWSSGVCGCWPSACRFGYVIHLCVTFGCNGTVIPSIYFTSKMKLQYRPFRSRNRFYDLKFLKFYRIQF